MDNDTAIRQCAFAHVRQLTELRDPLTARDLAPGKEGSQWLYGERSMVDSLLRLAVDTPENVRSRCLLLNTLEKEARRRSDIVREYANKLRLLQKEHPLPAGAAAELIKTAIATLEAKITLN